MSTATTEASTVSLQVILGSTRPNRNGRAVAEWAYETIKARPDVAVDLVDVAAFDLPLLDEPLPPTMRRYTRAHTQRWSETVARADGYLFVTGEYNHSIPGALKNAIDYLYHEWTNKAAGFVGYGSTGAALAVEHLRGVMAELQIADVREQLRLFLASDFENYSVFHPTERHAHQLHRVVDQVVAWSRALQGLRAS